MIGSGVGIGGEPPQKPTLNFQAAYDRYVKDEEAAGRQPLPIEQFIEQIMMAMQGQEQEQAPDQGAPGLLG